MSPADSPRRLQNGFLTMLIVSVLGSTAAQVPLQPRDKIYSAEPTFSALTFPVVADVDGDGFRDVVFMEPYGNVGGVQGAGRGWLLNGPHLGKPYVAFVSLDPVPGEAVGWGGVAVGDINRDGRADVLVGSPLWDLYELESVGRAMLYLGPDLKQGVVLHNPSPHWMGRFGEGGLLIADVTGDGLADVVVGAPGAYVGQDAEVGAVWVWPGQASLSGEFLGKPFRMPNPYPYPSITSSGNAFGRSLAHRATTSGGFEFFAGVHTNNGQGFGYGRVFGYSDGLSIPGWALLPNPLGAAAKGPGSVVMEFGEALLAPPASGPFDGKLIVSAPDSHLQAFDCAEAGAVFVFDGPDYQDQVLTLTSPDACTETRRRFGEKVLAADLDRDGHDELLISDPADYVPPPGVYSRVLVYRGPDYDTWQPVGEEWKTEVVFGRWMDAGDIDNDGFPELVVGRTNGFGPGFLVVYDVVTLQSDVTELSVSAGGDVRLHLSMAPEQAGAPYVTLLGGTGSMPGTILAGKAWIPLNMDAVTAIGMQLLGSPLLEGFTGTLDAQARATMTLHAPADLSPALVGQVLSIAAVTLPGDGRDGAGSTAVHIELVP